VRCLASSRAFADPEAAPPQPGVIEKRSQGNRKDQQEVGNDGPGLADQQDGASAKVIGQLARPRRC